MDKSDREFMRKLGQRIGEIEKQLANREKLTPAVTPDILPKLSNASVAANKFFGGEVATPEEKPGINGRIVLKGENPDEATMEEIKNGQEMLKKAIQEFCEEFDIAEFTITYKDNRSTQ